MTEQNGSPLPPAPPPATESQSAPAKKHPVPEYLKSVYGGRYFRPFLTKIFDDDWTAAVATFFQSGRLTKFVTKEIAEGNDVLQLGAASGDFESRIVKKMNADGRYVIEDISPAHIDAMGDRISAFLNAKAVERDFTVPDNERYDVVVGYFVLHEMPDFYKRATLERAVSALKPDGKMIFVDYARPARFHPAKYFISRFNRLFEPFAESLWHSEIRDFAPETDDIVWEKKTFFGGMYQGVIARKARPS